MDFHAVYNCLVRPDFVTIYLHLRAILYPTPTIYNYTFIPKPVQSCITQHRNKFCSKVPMFIMFLHSYIHSYAPVTAVVTLHMNECTYKGGDDIT